jgi:hypothetical protein
MPSTKTQTERVLERLRVAQLTQLEALSELGVMRLGARILELRGQRHHILTEDVEVRTVHGSGTARVARYTLIAEHTPHAEPPRPAFELAPPPGP